MKKVDCMYHLRDRLSDPETTVLKQLGLILRIYLNDYYRFSRPSDPYTTMAYVAQHALGMNTVFRKIVLSVANNTAVITLHVGENTTEGTLVFPISGLVPGYEEAYKEMLGFLYLTLKMCGVAPNHRTPIEQIEFDKEGIRLINNNSAFITYTCERM